MANSVDPDEKKRAISSGSTLFAQASVLVYQADRVKLLKEHNRYYNYTRLYTLKEKKEAEDRLMFTLKTPKLMRPGI